MKPHPRQTMNTKTNRQNKGNTKQKRAQKQQNTHHKTRKLDTHKKREDNTAKSKKGGTNTHITCVYI